VDDLDEFYENSQRVADERRKIRVVTRGIEFPRVLLSTISEKELERCVSVDGDDEREVDDGGERVTA
jgi:hypothetical protein